MNLKLWYNLKKAQKDLEPRPGFKRELNALLSRQFDMVYGKPGIWYRYVWVKTTRIIIASTLGVSMVGTSAYAYNSPQVTEGSVLYPIKISLEKIEEQTKVSPEAKVKFLFKKAGRREAERDVIVDKVGSEIKLTFSSVEQNSLATSTLTTSGTVSEAFSPTSSNLIVITTQPREVELIDRDIENVDHNLEDMEAKLGDSEEANNLKVKIQERINRHKIKDAELQEPIVFTSSTSVASTTLSFPTSTLVEFDREDRNTNAKNSFFKNNNILKKFTKSKTKEKIKIIQNEKGEIRVIDNENEYKIYSSSTPARIEQVIASSTQIRLEVNERDQETRWYRSESKAVIQERERQSESEKKLEEEKKHEEEKRAELLKESSANESDN
ncbi:MAG: hypothetical protein WC725_01215 [Patescibacteria group bacterium]|jgi:hypothetical protein